jgi:hypothetical protein
MKMSIYFLICIPALLLTLHTTGQTLYTKTDSIVLVKDTLIRLKLPVHRGNTQWQNSANGVNWTNISGKNSRFPGH